jgi:hypothetical protein
MSASEPEQAKLVHGERRMSIASFACDIMILITRNGKPELGRRTQL